MSAKSSRLYLWVICAIVIGGLLGHFAPEAGKALKPVSDGFIGLIKMLIGPIIFLTVVMGIAGVADVKKVGRVGVKAILYFEIVSTVALGIGLLVVNLWKPGVGYNADPATLSSTLDAKDLAKVAEYAEKAHDQTTVDFVLGVIPKTFTDAFTGDGNLLQVLLLACLFGFALMAAGDKARPVLKFFDAISQVFFRMMAMIMRLAPIGAGAAMAFTIGQYGVHSLGPLLKLMGGFYVSCGLFVVVVLGLIAKFTGFSIFKFLSYIRGELLLVLGTSSSESALVPLMQKLEKLGCPKSVVGLVVPSGYSFNLDGTNIYLTMAAIFIAQALNIDLSLPQQLTLLLVAMLTSKGAAGVTGAGFITLTATLAVVPTIPAAGLALIFGIDRFMSEARAITNIIGNGVATLVVSKWEGQLDTAKLRAELAAGPGALIEVPEQPVLAAGPFAGPSQAVLGDAD